MDAPPVIETYGKAPPVIQQKRVYAAGDDGEEEPKSYITKSGISLFEWWFVVAIAAVVDLVQIGVDALALTGIGAPLSILINRLIDVVFGLALGMYYKLRGVQLDTKVIFSLIATFVGETVPGLDALPLWTLDVSLTMSLDVAERQLKTLAPEASRALHTVTNVATKVTNVTNKLKGGTSESFEPAAPGSKPPVLATYGKTPPTIASTANVRPPIIARPNTLTQTRPSAQPERPPVIPPPTLRTQPNPAQTQTQPTADGKPFVGRTLEHDEELAQGIAAEHPSRVKTYDEWVSNRSGADQSPREMRTPQGAPANSPSDAPEAGSAFSTKFQNETSKAGSLRSGKFDTRDSVKTGSAFSTRFKTPEKTRTGDSATKDAWHNALFGLK